MNFFDIFDNLIPNPGNILSVIGSMLASTFGSLLSIAVYVVTALSVMTMWGKLGLRRGWLAWIPGVQEYCLGSLADEYAVRDGDERTKYRIVLPVMLGVRTVLAVFAVMSLTVSMGTVITAVIFGVSGTNVWNELSGISLAAGIVGLVLLLLCVLTQIPRWIVLNRIYRLFAPEMAGGFTVLNVLFSVSVPFTLLAASHHTPADPQGIGTQYL